jgi:3'-phosphoadenosine 5'-phosphosulfate sulfotransferase (PAPS reductase)/FAD synthetase
MFNLTHIDNEKHLDAIGRIESLFMVNTPISVSYSGGKDSSVLMGITLAAAILAKHRGADPFILVTNSDTGVENPEITPYVGRESVKIEAFAEQYGIELEYHTATPTINDEWAVQIFSGRTLPSFPQTNADCTVDFKIRPMRKLRKRILKRVQQERGTEVVTLVGTRLDESNQRKAKMESRNESHEAPQRNDMDELVYAAIADFTAEDVWEWVGLVRSNLLESYSDFNDLTRIYADAGNTSCAVVSDAISEGMKAQRGGCGARTGCIVCTKVKNDKSLSAMIASDNDRYGYMEAPSQLRQFLIDTQWDYSRRQWVGKTIRDNKIKIQPDTYSPKMCLELLRYALSIDANEKQLAMDLGLDKPRFELVSLEALVAIDAQWSLQGWHKPFQAMKEYFEIYEDGKRYDVPVIDNPVERKPIPKARYIHLSDKQIVEHGRLTGLRDHLLELNSDSHCMGTKMTRGGKVIMDIETEESFQVDLEGAFLALEFERETMMRIHDQASDGFGLTAGYKWWARMGVISLSRQQVSVHDEILRRTQLKEDIGIAGPNTNLEGLFSLCGQSSVDFAA